MGSVVKVLKELLPRLSMASTSFLPSQPLRPFWLWPIKIFICKLSWFSALKWPFMDHSVSECHW